MVENNENILPDKFERIEFGIGDYTVNFCNTTAMIQHGFGPLLSYSKQVGFIGLLPDNILIGSNLALRPFKSSDSLYAFELNRGSAVNRLLSSPTKRFADIMHIIMRNESPIFKCGDLDELGTFMVNLLMQKA